MSFLEFLRVRCRAMSFRLWTIFYVFALLGAAMATFGAYGIFVSALVIGFWAWIYSGPKPESCLRWAILF